MAKRKTKDAGGARPEDPTLYVHKAFRRMAFLLANLVCGIWLVLLLSTAALDENGPALGWLAVVLLVSAPLAYFIPYGLVRALGLVVLAFRKRNR